VTPWLAGAYGALALGLGWSLAGGSPWARRAPFIVAAPTLALGLWLGRPDPTGWPSNARVPSHSSLVSAVVREPDPATSDPGRIYLWLDLGGAAPRAFALPYSRPLHRQVEQALARVAQRRPVEVTKRAARRAAPGGRGVTFVSAQPPQLPRKPGAAAVASAGLTGP
jgi:hypothetical protein